MDKDSQLDYAHYQWAMFKKSIKLLDPELPKVKELKDLHLSLIAEQYPLVSKYELLK